MHMADALVSPEVGGTMWVAAGAAIAYSAKKIRNDFNDKMVPLMGVMGAFIFAAQMINFTLPGTGSSGHIGGGMILAILLGPYAAFIVLASILTVQALFFADGGLLALGCNIINMGIFPCFIAYPLIYKKIAGSKQNSGRLTAASIVSVLFALQLGAFFVVLETVLSGISELPFGSFLLVMQPIHLAIGLIEGVITAVVVNFIRNAEPDLLVPDNFVKSEGTLSLKKVIIGITFVALFTGGILSWFASAHPDGLEWTISKISGREEIDAPEKGIYLKLDAIQKKFSFLPDYGFKKKDSPEENSETSKEESWPAVESGTTLSGILGGVITMLMVAVIGFILRRRTETT